MALGPGARQEDSYRRGVVFGLTLGEAILLVLFSLLLAFTALFEKQSKEAKSREAEVVQLSETLAATQILVEKFADPEKYPDGPGIEDITREYIEAQNQLKIQKEELEKKKNKLALANNEKSALKQKLDSEREQANNFEIKLRDAESREKLAEQKLTDALKKNIDLKDKEQQNQKLRKEIEIARNKQRNLERRIGFGRGTEKPACWSVAEGKRKGAPEYIFDVAVLQKGFVIRDRKLPHRIEAQRDLPLGLVNFNEFISSGEFKRQLTPLYKWSESHDCRFFVAAYDNIPNDMKEVFKHQVDLMGERVYHYRYRNEKFPLEPSEILNWPQTLKSRLKSEDKFENRKRNVKGLNPVASPTEKEPKIPSKPSSDSANISLETKKHLPDKVGNLSTPDSANPILDIPNVIQVPVQKEPVILLPEKSDKQFPVKPPKTLTSAENESEEPPSEFVNPFDAIFKFLKKEIEKPTPESRK